MQRVERGNAAVGEAVDDFEGKAFTVKSAHQPATRFGAEIEREDFLRGHDALPDRLAATPTACAIAMPFARTPLALRLNEIIS